MNFNLHSRLEGQHAFLSASKYHWINYDEEKLVATFCKISSCAKRNRTSCSSLPTYSSKGVKLPKSKKTLNRYVNDGIGFQMQPEVLLYYSDNCFGTADTISFRKNILRISDYKSGDTPASIKQLMIYAALFCLEYKTSKQNCVFISLMTWFFIFQLQKRFFGLWEQLFLLTRKIEEMKIGG